ncbi:MAG: SAM-dependent methyltransferase [Alphaproteobacteria bacterium]|nr:MAG: SAM-dependent methyltransferase [Alphaproteobacteria bacterium]
MGNTIGLTASLRAYLQYHSVPETAELKALRAETRAKTEIPEMQICPEQGAFMRVMVRALGVRRYLEVGVFTGYSALAVALALPDDGRIVACDVNVEWTTMARRYWEKAGVANKIDLRLGPATETLQALIDDGETGTFDLMFIDADKESYATYYEQGLQLVRQGGMIMVDNVLWGGNVVDNSDRRKSTTAIRAINDRIAADDRVWVSMIPIGDGVTLAVKK